MLLEHCSSNNAPAIVYPMSAMKESVTKLQALHAKAGISDRFRGTLHDVPHSFTPGMQDEAFGWIDKWVLTDRRSESACAGPIARLKANTMARY
jgi:hypothetical protein